MTDTTSVTTSVPHSTLSCSKLTAFVTIFLFPLLAVVRVHCQCHVVNLTESGQMRWDVVELEHIELRGWRARTGR